MHWIGPTSRHLSILLIALVFNIIVQRSVESG